MSVPADSATPGPAPAERSRARRAGFAVFAVLAVTLGVQSVWITRNLNRLRPVSLGDVAPFFAVPAIDEHGHVDADQYISLPELRGRVVIVDFWATWCGPCIKSLPALDRVYRRYKDRGLMVISLNTDDPEAARRLMSARGYALPLYADDGHASHVYKVTSIPHLVIIDRNGVIRHIHRGFEGESVLDKQIDRLLR